MAATANMLIVDAERSALDSLANWFREDGYGVETAADAAAALQTLRSGVFDVMLLGSGLPAMGGIRLLESVRAEWPQTVVIMTSAVASIDTAVRALKLGAADFIIEPIDSKELSLIVRRALTQRCEASIHSQGILDDVPGGNPIIGSSPQIQKVLEQIDQVAKTDATVLILGETGTGKELVARAIHAGSRRRRASIVALNCGGLTETLLESELFGHEKGAFTGADVPRRGKVEMADGGTLFLDEVGAITPKMQIDLLRVLDTRESFRLGAEQPTKVDFRIICATNDDLLQAVRQGRFREDFYYRINVFTIELPPLRARRGDIPELANYFLDRLARQMNNGIQQIEPEAMELLVNHDWPGNVRELANAVERAMVVGRPPAIAPSDLLLAQNRRGRAPVQSLEEVERQHIIDVLARTEGNITRAAEILQVDRVTVYNKIKKYGLRP